MTSARDEVLDRVRRALAGARPEPVVVPRGYRESPAPDDLVGLFVERVEDYRATVHRCTPDAVEATLAGLVGDAPTVVPDGFDWPVPHPVPDDALTHEALDRVAGVVTTATLGIAITGTLVLTHGPGQGRRALTLVPDHHVCVVRADQVVAGVPEAVAALNPLRPQTWISGPSATSDIELDRVEGCMVRGGWTWWWWVG